MLGPSRSHASSSWEEGKQEAKELETSAVHLCPAPYRDYVVSHFKRRRRQWHPTPVLVPGKSYGRRSLVGCSPWGRKESDTTQRLHFHFSLSCIGEGNGNPLQCSCPENPRDGGAWWAAVYGVAQSRTRLKRLSSSSSNDFSEVVQSCPALCDPVDCSLPGSSVHGIFQAIVLEWIAISFSRESSQPRD